MFNIYIYIYIFNFIISKRRIKRFMCIFYFPVTQKKRMSVKINVLIRHALRKNAQATLVIIIIIFHNITTSIIIFWYMHVCIYSINSASQFYWIKIILSVCTPRRMLLEYPRSRFDIRIVRTIVRLQMCSECSG
jgi:hypothetical protein